MGTFAVISIMVGKTVLKYAHDTVTIQTMDNKTIEGSSDGVWLMEQPMYTPMQVVSSLCLVVGVIQLIMFVLRLGIISSLLSETLVSGFTTGAAIHVFTSQVKDLLGIKLTPTVGNFKVILVSYTNKTPSHILLLQNNLPPFPSLDILRNILQTISNQLGSCDNIVDYNYRSLHEQ